MIDAITKRLEELHAQVNDLNFKIPLLRTARTKLRLGWNVNVVLAEIHAAGIHDDILFEAIEGDPR